MAAPRGRFVDFVLERMAFVRDLRARPMFGGHGIDAGGRTFAIVLGETLYLKSDELVRAAFEKRGLAPFVYRSRGREVALRYYEAPPEVFDDAEAMRAWVGRSLAAAARADRRQR